MRKRTLFFFGMENVFLCRYEWLGASQKMHNFVDLKSFPVTVMRSNGCPSTIKDSFSKHVFDWIGLIQEHCQHVLCHYSERQGNFCHFMQEFNFPQDVWEYLCDWFHKNGVEMMQMPCRSVIWTKTLIGLHTVTMCVSKPIENISFKTERELNVLHGVFGTTCSMGL